MGVGFEILIKYFKIIFNYCIYCNQAHAFLPSVLLRPYMRRLHTGSPPPNTSALTLVEVTLVVTVLLGLITVAFSGMSAYKEGANRALCIHHVTNVQKAMRSYCHFQDLEPGQSTTNLRKGIFEDSQFFTNAPVCPSGGTYVFHEGTVPAIGTLFMHCSITGHAPKATAGW